MTRLEWHDGYSLCLPESTSKRATFWAARFTQWIQDHNPEPELVERAFQGLLDEERHEVLERVERCIMKEY